MKKLSLLFVMLLAFIVSVTAQESIPIPSDPSAEEYNDYGPDAVGLGINEFMYSIYPRDVDGNPLDSAKLSFSIFTDFDELYTFDAETYYEDHYVDFWADGVDRTELPYLIFNYDPFFTIWTAPFFPSSDPSLPANERFFQWRIGLQVYYTDNGMKSSSNIVYLEVYPKPVTQLGDVNDDGNINITDVTMLINYLLSHDLTGINKFNADVNESNNLNITDVTMLINYLLSKEW